MLQWITLLNLIVIVYHLEDFFHILSAEMQLILIRLFDTSAKRYGHFFSLTRDRRTFLFAAYISRLAHFLYGDCGKLKQKNHFKIIKMLQKE